MFNQGDQIELEGSTTKYVVLKTINDLGKFFLVLADEEEPTQLKFCLLEGSSVKIIQDPKLIDYIASKIEK